MDMAYWLHVLTSEAQIDVKLYHQCCPWQHCYNHTVINSLVLQRGEKSPISWNKYDHRKTGDFKNQRNKILRVKTTDLGKKRNRLKQKQNDCHFWYNHLLGLARQTSETWVNTGKMLQMLSLQFSNFPFKPLFISVLIQSHKSIWGDRAASFTLHGHLVVIY